MWGDCMIIYKVQNKTNGKIYIGQTARDIKVRIDEHCRHSSTAIDAAIAKYGIESFDVEQIDTAETIEELNEKEIYWIQFYSSMAPNGYNLCEGGDNTIGYHHKDISKRKMSVAKSKMYVGEGNPFYGKKHSSESKKKMSEKRKGLAHLTQEQIDTLRASHRTVKVRNIDTGEVFDSVKAAAERYGLKDTHITRVCKGKRKRTGGYRWEYAIQDNTVPSQ